MRNFFFQSNLPQQITLAQIRKLSNQSNLLPNEIEKWYERFIHCYTYGYVSFEEFQIYIKQLYIYHGNHTIQLSKLLIKQLFSILDLDKDQKLNFEEFFRFNLLISQGSNEDKLKFILNYLYEREKNYYFTQEEILNILTNMFIILDLSKSTNKLPEKLDQILTYINLNNRIYWNIFSTSILNNSILFELLLSNNFQENLISQF